MTRREFFEHLKQKGCEFFPPNEYGEANCIGVRNPATKQEAYLDTPIDDRRMRDATIGQMCSQLGVDFPECSRFVKPIIDEIANTDFSGDIPQPKKTRYSNKYPPPHSQN